MVNKRLLIQHLLSQHDEGTFLDYKESVDLSNASGRSKLLKHICALSNSNPLNESYLIIGVTDDKQVVGTDLLDDAVCQNLVKSFLHHPPTIKFENISFPTNADRPVGLLTIHAKTETTSFLRTIDKINTGAVFHRIGSTSVPIEGDIALYPANETIVNDLLRASRVTIKEILSGVIEFKQQGHPEYRPTYTVFHEQFVVCWSAWGGDPFYSEMDIRIINDGVRIFISANQDVKIEITDEKFQIIEHIYLGYGKKSFHFPFESTTIVFRDNGTYSINNGNIFVVPTFDNDEIIELYQTSQAEANRILKYGLGAADWEVAEGISMDFFICYLHGIKEAREHFFKSSEYVDGAAAQWFRHCKRIMEALENK